MKQLTDKQKKYIGVAVAVLLFVHLFGAKVVTFVRSTIAAHQTAPIPKPSPLHPAVMPAPATASAQPQVNKQLMDYYSGIWTAHVLPNQEGNACDFRLEMRVNPEQPDKLMGYLTKTCFPAVGVQHRSAATLANDISPVSSIMIGTIDRDYIVFAIDQTDGTHPGDCPLTEFSTRVFGLGGLNAEWKDGTCDSGSVLLTKARG
jgi:hypothetical protein